MKGAQPDHPSKAKRPKPKQPKTPKAEAGHDGPGKQPGGMSHNQAMQLQPLIGNRAFGQMLGGPAVQRSPIQRESEGGGPDVGVGGAAAAAKGTIFSKGNLSVSVEFSASKAGAAVRDVQGESSAVQLGAVEKSLEKQKGSFQSGVAVAFASGNVDMVTDLFGMAGLKVAADWKAFEGAMKSTAAGDKTELTALSLGLSASGTLDKNNFAAFENALGGLGIPGPLNALKSAVEQGYSVKVQIAGNVALGFDDMLRISQMVVKQKALEEVIQKLASKEDYLQSLYRKKHTLMYDLNSPEKTPASIRKILQESLEQTLQEIELSRAEVDELRKSMGFIQGQLDELAQAVRARMGKLITAELQEKMAKKLLGALPILNVLTFAKDLVDLGVGLYGLATGTVGFGFGGEVYDGAEGGVVGGERGFDYEESKESKPQPEGKPEVSEKLRTLLQNAGKSGDDFTAGDFAGLDESIKALSDEKYALLQERLKNDKPPTQDKDKLMAWLEKKILGLEQPPPEKKPAADGAEALAGESLSSEPQPEEEKAQAGGLEKAEAEKGPPGGTAPAGAAPTDKQALPDNVKHIQEWIDKVASKQMDSNTAIFFTVQSEDMQVGKSLTRMVAIRAYPKKGKSLIMAGVTQVKLMAMQGNQLRWQIAPFTLFDRSGGLLLQFPSAFTVDLER